MKIVCDTNVIVSGILFGGHSRAILSSIARGRVEAFTTPALLNELREVLTRRKFRLRAEQVAVIIEMVKESFAYVEPRTLIRAVADDPDDDRVLEAADAAGARVIISGDRHLLTLKAWHSIAILSPAEFVSAHLDGQ